MKKLQLKIKKLSKIELSKIKGGMESAADVVSGASDKLDGFE